MRAESSRMQDIAASAMSAFLQEAEVVCYAQRSRPLPWRSAWASTSQTFGRIQAWQGGPLSLFLMHCLGTGW